jgi:hypothetical protein
VKDDRSIEGKEKHCRTSCHTYRTCFGFMGAFLTGLVIASAVWAADHREAPIVNARPDGDISDVFAFLDPNNASRLVLAMGVNTFAIPAVRGSYSFSQQYLYQFKIDNNGDAQEDWVVQVAFVGTGSSQQVRLLGPAQPADPGFVGATNALVSGPVLQGAVNTTLGDPAGVQVFASLTDDSFVFDVGQFNRILGGTQDVFRDLPTTGLGVPVRGRPVRDDGTSGVDSFGGINIGTIAVSLPLATVQGGATRLNIWGTVSEPRAGQAVVPFLGHPYAPVIYVQFERMGQAVFATVFISSAQRDAFNAEIPSNDVARFSSTVPDALTTTDNDGTGNTIAGRAALLTNLGLASLPSGAPLLLPGTFANTNKDLLRVALLPDVIRLDLNLAPNDLAVGQFGLSNGRRPQDDEVDIALRLVRQLADVNFPPGSGVPGSGPARTGALDCTTLPACPDRRVLAVLQGTDFIKPDSQVADVTTSGTDRAFPSPYVFPFFASAHPFPGEPGTVGFPPQQ